MYFCKSVEVFLRANQWTNTLSTPPQVQKSRDQEIFCYLEISNIVLFTKNKKTKFVVKLGNIGLLTPRSLAIEQETNQSPFNSFAIAIHCENDFFAIMIPILTLVVDSLWKWFPSERNSFQDWMFRLWSSSSTHKQMQIWNRLPLHNIKHFNEDLINDYHHFPDDSFKEVLIANTVWWQ